MGDFDLRRKTQFDKKSPLLIGLFADAIVVGKEFDLSAIMASRFLFLNKDLILNGL